MYVYIVYTTKEMCDGKSEDSVLPLLPLSSVAQYFKILLDSCSFIGFTCN